MRLTAVKLAGFKSFVDPTTIRFPSNLMAVVGPNGCGKSNIIDAVRWVMGEGSARQLRGESMSDVIFSGSSARKPVATATVELVFDNANGRAGGEYASYNEISVKRQVSRDGYSNYYLNGTRCRRKDITDLFLGTGLGPRSYAIIEQGMISQIVEARPEELRAFLEEAAGISRYKERRKETESRIRHTRENLDRLADLREEVGKQLAKLQRQARAAERYRKLKLRYRADEARLTALKWRQIKSRVDAEAQVLKQTENRLQAAIARQREAEKSLETLREQQHKASDRAGAVQGELYEVAGEIARLEQAIEHQQELIERQRAEHAETEGQLDELKQHRVLDKAQVEEVTRRLGELEPALETARGEEQAAREAFDEAEKGLQARRADWQANQDRSGQARQRTELLKLRIEHLDERMGQAAGRLNSLGEGDDSARTRLEREASGTRGDLARADREVADREARLRDGEEALTDLRVELERQRDLLEQHRARMHEDQGRLASLKVLNTPRQSGEAVDAWLNSKGLAGRPSLLESLSVDGDWRRAVETVLKGWLSARVLEDGDGGLPDGLPDSELGLVRQNGPAAEPGRLAHKVRGAGALSGLLNRVHLAEDEAPARRMAETLAAGDSVITPQGLWLGPGWLWQAAGSESGDGALARQDQIRHLEEAVVGHQQAIGEAERRLTEVRAQTEAAAAGLAEARQELDAARQRQAELAGIRAGQDNRLKALEQQRQAEQQEVEALKARQEADTQAVSRARSELESALAELEAADREQQPLRQALEEAKQALDSARNGYRTAREERERIALKLESSRASLESLRQAISRMDTQIGQLQGRYLELSEALGRGDEPVREHKVQRDQLLDQRLAIEQRLKESRGRVEELEQAWREHDQRRQAAAGEADEIREEQSRRKLAWRELEINAERLAARVAELDGDLEQLVSEIPDDAETEAWAAELDRLAERIRRLEPVNLAAIEEYRSESERKEYLDRQLADLVEALETLEAAIGRIDRTTRTRFRETFERVNRNMEELFPRLFGGGHGHLEMTGDDWLTAGTAILARPPGKRISRIHLLSGGEKALTAVAFVFAIFNLNPAPFCLLDEVDAPLDDANVGRFSELVRELSERLQVVLVTHNKVTMEVAHQMLGVTMREPGISRLVSVDLDRAVAMAAS